jgi:hypothetical protein
MWKPSDDRHIKFPHSAVKLISSNLKLILGIVYLLPLIPTVFIATLTFTLMSMGQGFLNVALPFGLISITPLVCTVMIISGKTLNNWLLTVSYIFLFAMLLWMGQDKSLGLEEILVGIYFSIFVLLNLQVNKMNLKDQLNKD